MTLSSVRWKKRKISSYHPGADTLNCALPPFCLFATATVGCLAMNTAHWAQRFKQIS